MPVLTRRGRDGRKLPGHALEIALERSPHVRRQNDKLPPRVRWIGTPDDETHPGQILDTAHGRAGGHLLGGHAE